MSDRSKIEYVDATWNPIAGCSPVSDGCESCYAARMASRFSGPGKPFEALAERGRWTGAVKFAGTRVLAQPLRWRKPRRIFVCSMGDLFHEGVLEQWIAAVFGVMAATPRHTYLVLTKRPRRAQQRFAAIEKAWQRERLAPSYCPGSTQSDLCRGAAIARGAPIAVRMNTEPWPLPNVWLGVSVEDQPAADERVPQLLMTPAVNRFVSCEPLLGPVDLAGFMGPLLIPPDYREGWGLDWVIAGGETGPGARPMDPDWARSLRDQCRGAGVPFFFKQHNKKGDRLLDGELWEEIPCT